MIRRQYLFPEYYIRKIPVCDKCTDVVLQDMHIELPVYPPKYKFICPECNTIYEISLNDLEGEWKWRAM